jgi:peptidoglycan hydrolase-like protein with peptidoglycan-binding domain
MKTKLAIMAVVLLAGVTAAAAIAFSSSDSQNTATDAAESTPDEGNREINTAVVARKDFVEETEVDGTLGFGASETLPNLASGVLTWLPQPGDIVEVGDTLFEVNARPVILVTGKRPYHRTLDSRSSDGPDVEQLEQFLTDAGFADESNLTVDRDFTSSTANAIERWEASLGLEETGSLPLGTLVVRSAGFRIEAVNASLGQQINGGSVLVVTSTERLVTVPLDTGLTGLLTEGQIVDVELPDESVVPGTVTFVSDIAVTEGQGPQATSYLEVEIVLDGEGSAFDQSPVTIRVEEILEEDATVVPIASLLALAEGGYAVEVVTEQGAVLVGIRLGTFLDNEVAITGEVAPGDQVIIP